MKKLSDRKFGLVFTGVFGVIWGLGTYVFGATFVWPLIVAGSFAFFALVWPIGLLPLNRFWSHFAEKFGHFNNTLILSLFYFLVLTPVGFCLRVFGKDPMDREMETPGDSAWHAVTRQASNENLPDLF